MGLDGVGSGVSVTGTRSEGCSSFGGGGVGGVGRGERAGDHGEMRRVCCANERLMSCKKAFIGITGICCPYFKRTEVDTQTWDCWLLFQAQKTFPVGFL